MTQRAWLWPVIALVSCATPLYSQTVTLNAPGAEDDLVEALEGASLSLALDAEDGAAPQDFVAAARADYQRLLAALYDAGFYGPAISIRVDGREASGIAPLDAPGRISRVDIAVNPGPQFTFGRAELRPVPPGTEVPESYAPGQPAAASAVRDAARAGVQGWREQGHALAAPVGQEITANHPARRLDASVTLGPGPRLTFGQVTVSGAENVREERIRAIAGLPEGEVYSPAEIDAAARRLRRTGAFDSAALVEADAPGPGDTLPVTIQVEEALPRRLGFGAEIATLDGLTLSAYWLHRNLLGGAERFRVEAEASGIGGETGGTDLSLGFSFARPATIRANIDLEAEANFALLDETGYELDLFEGEVRLVRTVSPELSFGGGVGVVLARERKDSGAERLYRLVTLPLSGTLDRRDQAADARSGYYLDLELTPLVATGSEGPGVRGYLDARAYVSPGASDRFTLAGRLQLGAIAGAQADDLPPNLLFFSGGGGTVRGQSYQSLALSDPGDPAALIGGTSFLGAQIEARARVTERIGVVGFYDFGMVGAGEFPSSDDDWHAGAGLGVRYDTPIGPIRLDLATPASGDDAFSQVHVYVGIGQAF